MSLSNLLHTYRRSLCLKFRIMVLTAILRIGNRLFTRYLLATNIGASCVLMNAGDFIVQGMQHKFQKKPGKELSEKWVDWGRSGQVFTIGGVLGVMTHYWYAILDSKLPGKCTKTVLKKIFLDQVVASPVFMSVFFIGNTLLENGTFREGVNRVKEKFLVVYMADWSFWPVVQGVNFRFIPDRFRVVYVSSCSLVWTVFLSYMQFVDEKHLGAEEKAKETQEENAAGLNLPN